VGPVGDFLETLQFKLFRDSSVVSLLVMPLVQDPGSPQAILGSSCLFRDVVDVFATFGRNTDIGTQLL